LKQKEQDDVKRECTQLIKGNKNEMMYKSKKKGTNVLNQRQEKYNPYTTNNRSSKAGMNF
jgi:hypothetical protein